MCISGPDYYRRCNFQPVRRTRRPRLADAFAWTALCSFTRINSAMPRAPVPPIYIDLRGMRCMLVPAVVQGSVWEATVSPSSASTPRIFNLSAAIIKLAECYGL